MDFPQRDTQIDRHTPKRFHTHTNTHTHTNLLNQRQQGHTVLYPFICSSVDGHHLGLPGSFKQSPQLLCVSTPMSMISDILGRTNHIP